MNIVDSPLIPVIPQVAPGAAALIQLPSISKAIARVIRSGTFIMGQEGEEFEREFGTWLGSEHTFGCASGTDALVLALQGCGIGPGMTVAAPAHTAVATIAAIELTGAVPLLLDVEPSFYTLDPVELGAVLRMPPPDLPPIRAVIPVHLYGQVADMLAILAVCQQHGVIVVEDCSQAHGATVFVRGGCHEKAGSLGDAAAFSFYPTKNLAALGDGGLVATNKPSIAKNIAALRQYGWDHERVCQIAGRNSRLDEIQAAILRVRLPLLDAANRRRNTIATAFDAALAGTGIEPPQRRPGCTHVFHQYIIRSKNRADLRARLMEYGIATGVHYPLPIHHHPAYTSLPRGPASCQMAAKLAAEVVSLPVHAELTDGEISRICAALQML